MLPVDAGRKSRESPPRPDPRIAAAETVLASALDHHRAGDLKKACDLYRKILKSAPRHAEALHLLGLATLELGKAGRAAQLIGKAAALAPGNTLYRINLGEAYRLAGKPEEAAAAYRAALSIDSGFVPALASLGNLLKTQGQIEEAVACHRRAAALQPGSAELKSNLGLALRDAGKIDEALVELRGAAGLAPRHADIQFNLGNVLLAAGMAEEAEAAFARTVELDPGHARAWCNRGIALREQGRGVQAAAALRKALDLVPDWADAHWNLALALLMDGKFAEGWREYEWRRRIPGFAIQKPAGPEWDGSALAGRTLLLRAEQGLGDAIQFARYARLAGRSAGKVVLECPPALVRLFRGSGLCDAVTARGEPVSFDVEAPLMSGPYFLDPDLAAASASVPYLAAEPELIARWKARLSQGSGLKIGIAWQGNPAYRADRMRSIPLAHFFALARRPGIRLVSLQKGFGAEQLDGVPAGVAIENLGRELDESTGAFVDTAAVIAGLDLVICSDSACAHLAGALGKDVWVALAASPDWRWGRSGERSPWYPTTRLFRQSAAGDWAGVFSRIADALGPRLAGNEGG